MNSQQLLIVIRGAGERTLECCKSICTEMVGHENVATVHEAPFERALLKMCDIAINSQADWIFSLDADVILCSNAVKNLLEKAETCDINTFQIHAPVVCKLFGGIRLGMRMYRTKSLRRFREAIPREGTEMRPETFAVNQMTAEGFRTVVLPDVIGIHDFEQSYRDIYRKAFVHGQKHVSELPKLLPTWKERSIHDADFRMAIRGVFDGLIATEGFLLDPAFFQERAAEALKSEALCEKPTLHKGAITSATATQIISNQEWPLLNGHVKRAIAAREKSLRRARLYRDPIGWMKRVPTSTEKMLRKCLRGLTGRQAISHPVPPTYYTPEKGNRIP